MFPDVSKGPPVKYKLPRLDIRQNPTFPTVERLSKASLKIFIMIIIIIIKQNMLFIDKRSFYKWEEKIGKISVRQLRMGKKIFPNTEPVIKLWINTFLLLMM